MKQSRVILLPLVLILLTPFLVYEIPIILDGEFFLAWTGEFVVLDYFSIIKSVMLISSAIIMIFFMIGMFKELRTIDKIVTGLIIIYIILVLLSHLFSEYKQISLFGIVDRFEGTLVLISYGLILLYTMIVSRFNKNYQILFTVFIICSGLLAIIGFLQFINMDPFLHPLVYDALFPSYSEEIIPFLSSHFGRVDITMYNSNYVGSFVALTFPITFFMLLDATKPYQRYLYLMVNILLFIVAIASRSRAGLLGIIGAVLFGLILSSKSKIKRVLYLLPIYILIFNVMNSYAGGSLAPKFNTLISGVEEELIDYKNVIINDIQMFQNKVYISTNIKNFSVTITPKSIVLNDEQSNVLQLVKNSNNQFIHDESDMRIIITRETKAADVVKIQIDSKKIDFFYQDDKIQLINARSELLTSFKDVDMCCFIHNESFASFRGYIWSRSIPLLKETLLIGHGADTFTMYFPQHDVFGKLNTYGSALILIDKPHNNYIQIAHDTGVLSLMVLFALIMRLFIVSLTHHYSKKYDDKLKPLRVSVLSGIVGYLIAAIFNDSVVHVAPYFWFILGLSFALIDKKLDEQENK